MVRFAHTYALHLPESIDFTIVAYQYLHILILKNKNHELQEKLHRKRQANR